MNDMTFDPAKGMFDPLNVDLDSAGIAQFHANSRFAATNQINTGLEANPDDAAESIDLSDITGLPAPHVLNNLDEVKDTVRRRTAQELVLNNPELITYLQAHPMAASVSNDDWGNLDKFSADAGPTARLMKALNPFGTAVDTVDAALKAFQENSQTDIPGALTEAQKAADYLVPSAQGGGVTAHAVAFGAAAAGELLLQTMSALASGASAAAGAGTQTYLQSLEDRTGGKFGQGLGLGSPEQAGREASSLVEWQMQRGDLPLTPHGGEAPGGVTGAGRASPFGDAMAKAAPWVESGIEPPAGVHPLIDEAKAKINAGMLESMERDLENAQASLTKERSPELFQRFVDQHFGDSAFDINSDAVLGLYGDKPPTPDDGLLGWVPGIDAQLAAARDIGTPITVKMTDWLARVDPAVSKSLRDDIRMWPGGITANEAKVPIPPHDVIGTPPTNMPPPDVEEWKKLNDATNEAYDRQDDAAGRQLRTQADALYNRMSPEQIAEIDAWDQKSIDDARAIDTERDRQSFSSYEGRVKVTSRAIDRLPNNLESEEAKVQIDKIVAAMESEGLHSGDPMQLLKAASEHRRSEWQASGSSSAQADELVTHQLRRLRQAFNDGPGRTAVSVPEAVRSPMLLDGPLPQVRDASGLEPKFSMGDRKLTLSGKVGDAADDILGRIDNYTLHDEHGQEVGNLRIGRGDDKELLVDWIGGKAGLWANNFGPSLMRDLKRQLKALYPDYEYLIGYRVSGARHGPAQTVGGAIETAIPRVKLSIDDTPAGWGFIEGDHQKMQEIFQNGWRRFTGDYEVNMQDKGFYTPEQIKAGEIASEELDRIAGLRLKGAAGIRRGDSMVRGIYVPSGSRPPMVMLDLLGPDVVGTGHHETIHHLRRYGFYTDAEWAALESHAQQENWLGRYDIDARYPTLDRDGKLEEAVADGFREWTKQAPEIRPTTGIGAVFQKMWDFLDRIRQKLGLSLGKEITWEDVFQRTYTGEVKKRGAGEPPPGAFDIRASIEGDDNLRAQAVGLPVESFRQLQEAYRKQHEADLKAAQTRAEKDQTRRQSKEWRANRADMAKEVSAEINQRPDIMADAFIGSGELGGKKLQQRFTLRAGDLTPEQQAVLPGHYVSTHGLPADSVAGMFGYGSKAELVDALAKVNAMRQAATGDRLGKGDFMRQLVQGETDRRMELRYGRLDENIMDAAQDQALSDASMNVMHEELTAQAMKAGVTVFDKEVMQSAAKNLINEQPIGKVNSYKLMQLMGKHSRDAQKALLDDDAAGAAVAMQKQTVTAYAAKEARDVEKTIAKADKFFKSLAPREKPSIPPEYMNWAHSIMNQIGKPVRRSVEDLTREIEATETTTLQDFVKKAEGRLQIMPVWDQLFDRSWSKPYKELTVPEFQAVYDSVKSIVHNGREEKKLIKQGASVDFADGVAQLSEALDQFKILPMNKTEGKNIATRMARGFLARTLQVENIFDRWDRWNPKGAWSQMVFRDMIDATNQSDAWRKDTAKKLMALGDDVDLRESLPNGLFFEPESHGGRELLMTRESLRTVMLNMGTESNLNRMSKGWKVQRDALEAWVHTHATEKDWAYVRGVWKIFNELKGRADTMYRSMSEVPAESIEGRKIISPDFGEIEGGYYPLFRDKIYAPAPPQTVGELMGQGFEAATPAAAYMKSRNEAALYPVALDMDRMANRMVQMIHDTAVRPAVVNAYKIFRAPEIKGAIVSRYGKEYHDMMEDWVRSVANASNSVQGQASHLRAFSDFMRTNVMSALIGFNPGTWLKHGLTAAGLSAKEVGPLKISAAFGETAPAHIKDALHSLFNVNSETADSNYHFAMNNSLELQRRERNFQENIYGAAQQLTRPKSFWGKWQDVLIQAGSAPIAFSDKLSSVPVWLAKYREGMANGEAHGDAVAAADKAVRRAHGSTATAARPMLMNDISPWFTTFYNFFNDIFNRQAETLWRSGEVVKLAKAGQKEAAMKQAGLVAAGIIAYSLYPAFIENAIAPEDREPGDSWAKRAGKAIFRTEGATIPIVRDVANAILHGKDPDIGLFSTELKSVTDFIRDFNKPAPFSPAHAQHIIRSGGELLGVLTGMPQQAARVVSGVVGLNTGQEHPRGPWGWGVLMRYGTIKGHSPTFDDYMAGRSLPAR